ncbi:hypothetical protein IGI04_014256 [Brassica rapa subsp. trilocularis]|uniref:Knottin scorpion toxin-like domain-containing protein n=3 Tax=Brassica TaxID=3705 RepID=A0ABQ7MLP2_BRACM|nr:hypothetical protein IGI04_014256 [Brassica rapa subsp. trilocularis]CAF1846727.1 unnamed protein product [Brassica napus]
MAKSLCIVTLLMIFLLISTGLPNGEAQCAGKRSEAAPENICNLEDGLRTCRVFCTTVDGYLRGKCDNEDGEIVCNCYDCEA